MLKRTLTCLTLLVGLLISPAPALAAVTYTTCPDFTTFAADIASDGAITFNLATDCAITFTSAISITSTVSITNLAYGTHTVTFNAPAGARHFTVSANGDLSLDGVTLTNNNPSGYSGGIDNAGSLAVTSSTFSGNSTVFDGGAIINFGTLAVTSSTFSGNSAVFDGGAIINLGTLTVTSSTFSGNRAERNGGAIRNNSTLAVTNSTFIGNSAQGYGGAIFSSLDGTVTSSTFSGNSAVLGGGIDTQALLTITDSIIASSGTGYNCSGPGPITSSGANFADDASCPGFTQSANLRLGPLADNGGPTHTIALLAGSDAIDAATTSTLTTDQRGYARPVGAANDSGAYEFGTVPPLACLITLHQDGRINAADGCAPFAVFADGAGGLEVYATVAPDYIKGALLASVDGTAISAALAGVTKPNTQALIASGGGVDIYALPGGQIKVEIAGAYGFEFPAALLAGASEVSAPLVLPATLPETGGAMRNPGGWLALLALVTGAGVAAISVFRSLRRDR